jgi:hypothetical protein
MNTINKSFRFESISHRGQYHGKRAEAILRSLSSPGGVIVEHHVRRALEEQGFDLIIEIISQSTTQRSCSTHLRSMMAIQVFMSTTKRINKR